MKLVDFLVNLRSAVNGINSIHLRKQFLQIIKDFENCKELDDSSSDPGQTKKIKK